jgi:hypothetical protein
MESSEDIWRAFGISSIANFFGIWFVIAIGKFLVTRHNGKHGNMETQTGL